MPLVGQDYLEILSAWYCSFGKCCETGDCRIVNNITGRCCAASQESLGRAFLCFFSLLSLLFFSKKCVLASHVAKGHFWEGEGLS